MDQPLVTRKLNRRHTVQVSYVMPLQSDDGVLLPHQARHKAHRVYPRHLKHIDSRRCVCLAVLIIKIRTCAAVLRPSYKGSVQVQTYLIRS